MFQFHAIIFDFDGTLAECRINFDLLKRKVAALASGFLDSEIVPNNLPVLEWVEDLAQELQIYSPDSVLEFKSRVRLLLTAVEIKAAGKGMLFPMTRSILGSLKKVGIQTGIITRNCTPGVKIIFPDLWEYCQVFLPREDVVRIKPHPEHLISAIKMLGVSSSRVLMVGDNKIDIQTANKAKVYSAGLATDASGRKGLIQAGANFVARDVEDLVHHLIESHYLPSLDQVGYPP